MPDIRTPIPIEFVPNIKTFHAGYRENTIATHIGNYSDKLQRLKNAKFLEILPP